MNDTANVNNTTPAPRTANPDTEPMIEVEWETRNLIVPESLYDIGVTGDNNAETVYIKAADSFDGISLEGKTAYVWFRNARKEDYRQEIDDIRHEGDYLILGWKIDSRLTRYKGEVQFKVGFDSTLYSLSTLPGKLNISETLAAEFVLENQEENITEQFLRRLSDLELLAAGLGDQISELRAESGQIQINLADITQLRNEVKFLKEHAVLVN